MVGLTAEGHASGFSIPELSVSGIGMSNALVANPEDLGAFPYNPAATAFHEGSSINVGAIGIVPSLSVTTATGGHDSDSKDLFGAPSFFGTLRIGEDWTLGLGFGAPFGLETKWRLGTFPILSTPETSAAHPTKSKLELLALTPTVAYRIGEHAAVSVGIDYYNASDLNFNTADIEIQGDGDGWGWNLGFLYDLDRLSFGINFRSSSEINVEGRFQAFGEAFGPADGIPIPAKANLDLPWRLQAGVRYEATERLAVELDVTRTGWSEFEQIQVKADGGGVLTTSTNKWDDANAYRLGVSYQLTPRTLLRFGYTYDNTGQDDDHFSARIPDADRQLFSLGVGHNLGDGWGLDAGYMYVRFDDRNYNSSVPFGTFGSDPNGTAAYNGKYDSHVHLFGLGVTKTFL
jgi:long-chain fatty acid transport protein